MIRTRAEHRIAERLTERDHDTAVEYDEVVGQPRRRRARCTCGWTGRWRTSATRGWDAQADADEHHNGEH